MKDRRPGSEEYPAYFARYIGLVPPGPILKTLADQIEDSLQTLRTRPSGWSLSRYQPGKWSVQEVVGHLMDTERIMSGRALRFGRSDSSELPGFEQDEYVRYGGFDRRDWNDLLDEFRSVRSATVSLFAGLPAEAWQRKGTADGSSVSVRALAFIVAGHERHHMQIIRQFYPPVSSRQGLENLTAR